MINEDGGGLRHWAIVETPAGEPAAELCECPLSYPHEPDGTPDLTAPPDQIPHRPNAAEVIPVRARCLTCGGELEWHGGGWRHTDAPHLDLEQVATDA